MFDLVEEDLSKQEEVKKETAIPKVDAVVYTMPEKFRRTVKTSNSKFVLIIIAILAFLAITATVLFLIFTQTKQPPPQEPVAPPVEETKKKITEEAAQAEEAATSTENGTETPEVLEEATSTPAFENEEATSTQEIAPVSGNGPVIGLDSDADGLSDVEERMYNTNSQVQDSDGDGFSDGEELENLFDPTRIDGAKLEISGLASPFTNRTFSYALFYPASWSARAVNQSDREVVFGSASGEFVSVAIQDNPSQLSAIDWYVSTKDPSADTSTLKTLSLNNWSAVLDPAGRAAYLVKTDTAGAILAPYVYLLTYNPNTSAEAQFQTSFMMMIRSFVFTDLSFVR
ncbi:hypothetical protein HY621_04110 [Candidatus Uhrbacteria bacterium]|nr:hypothetical protein [Candidatus Uhrbacteria bacterium]